MAERRTSTVWLTATVVLSDDYPGDTVDLQQDVTRVLDDTPIVHNGRTVGHVAIVGITSSDIRTVPVD